VTDYFILMEIPDPTPHGEETTATHWLIYDRKQARSGDSAIRASLSGGVPEIAGRLVAVPARSWRPVTVKVETKTALKFS